MHRRTRTVLVLALGAGALGLIAWWARSRLPREATLHGDERASARLADPLPANPLAQEDGVRSERALVDAQSRPRGTVHVLASCPHHEFDLPGVIVEARVENEIGAVQRTLHVKDGDPFPNLAPGERLASNSGVVLPEPEWQMSVCWRPRKSVEVRELVASVFVCFDVDLSNALAVPGTPSSPISVQRGRLARAGRMQSAVGPNRYLLTCDPFGTPPAGMTIARDDGTCLGFATLDPSLGRQTIGVVDWTPVGAIRCDLGAKSVGLPCTLEWSAAGLAPGSEMIQASSGEHLIPWLSPGVWRVRAVGPALLERAADVEVTAGRLTDLDLQLARDPSARCITCSISRESSAPIEDSIRGDLAEIDDPEVHQEFEWESAEVGSATLLRTAIVRSSARLRLLVDASPGIGCRVTPDVIGPLDDRVDVVLLDRQGTLEPLLRVEFESGEPVMHGWWYSIHSRRSNSFLEGKVPQATGQVREFFPSDEVLVTIASAEGEFDPVLFTGSTLAALGPTHDSEPLVVKVHSPPTIGRLLLLDARGSGIGSVEARLEDGTMLHTDDWGYLAIPAGALAGTLSVPGHVFDLGSKGRTAVLALPEHVGAGDLVDSTLVLAPRAAK